MAVHQPGAVLAGGEGGELRCRASPRRARRPPAGARGGSARSPPCARTSASAAGGSAARWSGVAVGDARQRGRGAGRERSARATGARAPPTGAGGARPAAASTTTWALVPLNPNELTPARRRPPAGCHGRELGRDLRRGAPPRRCAGWARGSAGAAGSRPCSSITTSLISPAMPAAASRWPRLVLTEPTSSGWSAGAAPAEGGAQGLDLDRVAERRAGAVGLDVADGRRRDAAVGQRGADDRLLRRAVRRGQAAAGPSWLTAVPRMTARIRSPSARASARRFSTTTPQPSPRTKPSAARVERLAAAVGRHHLELGERDGRLRAEDEVDPAGQRQVHSPARRLCTPGARRRATTSRPCRARCSGPRRPRT